MYLSSCYSFGPQESRCRDRRNILEHKHPHPDYQMQSPTQATALDACFSLQAIPIKAYSAAAAWIFLNRSRHDYSLKPFSAQTSFWECWPYEEEKGEVLLYLIGHIEKWKETLLLYQISNLGPLLLSGVNACGVVSTSCKIHQIWTIEGWHCGTHRDILFKSLLALRSLIGVGVAKSYHSPILNI